MSSFGVRIARLLGAGGLLFSVGVAQGAAAELPELRLSARNSVPACVTPERLEAMIAERNGKLEPRFKGIAGLYKSHGESVGVRWDYAFYQMVIETNALSFKRAADGRGKLNPDANNFAGIGATGNEDGERFKDVSTGVLAHLQHVRLYTGDPAERPTAKRTRDVQSFIVPWAKGLRRPVTYSDLAQRWSPDKRYASELAAMAKAFRDRHCAGKEDESVAARNNDNRTVKAPSEVDSEAEKPVAKSKFKSKSAKRRGRKPAEDESETAENKGRNEKRGEPLMQSEIAQATKPDDDEETPAEVEQKALKAAPKDKAAPKEKRLAAPAEKPAEKRPEAPPQPPTKTASVTPPAQTNSIPTVKKSETETAAPVTREKAANCRVWTASFGGDRAILIKVLEGGMTSYTALEVSSAQAQEQTGAFIAAYAKGGIKVGEFASREEALARAFELCPQT